MRSSRRQPSLLRLTGLGLVVLGLLAAPRLQLPQPRDAAPEFTRATPAVQTPALPAAQGEPFKLPAPFGSKAPGTTGWFAPHVALCSTPPPPSLARPVERGVWRGVKSARLRACPPQGPPLA